VSVVELSKIETRQAGKYVGHILLNRPKALNALNVEMLGIIHATLAKWRGDKSIAAIWIEGAGDRAFCAGGDVIALYEGMQKIRKTQRVGQTPSIDNVPDNIVEFFIKEYETDFQLYSYPKPVIAWGSGYIMGGGFGLYSGAKYRIATPTTRYAMPENSIGLFPDVGASYFLNKLPSGVGMFLGLTGAQVNAVDAHNIGLATHVFESQSKQSVIDALCALDDFTDDSLSAMFTRINSKTRTVDTTIEATQSGLLHLHDIKAEMPEFSAFEGLGAVIDHNQALPDLGVFFKNITDNKWLQKAIDIYNKNSPLACRITFEQLTRGRDLNVEQCFKQEFEICFSALFQGEFFEGVRALLIDKDKQPMWQFKETGSVPDELVDTHFKFFNQKEHPLYGMTQKFLEHQHD